MRRHELIGLLCYDGQGSPYPLEALYDLEGLSYVELIEINRAHGRGEPPRSFTRGGARRRIAEQLGADQEQSKLLAQRAGSALEHVGRTATQLGVRLGAGDLRQRVDALERQVEGLLSREAVPENTTDDDVPERLRRVMAITADSPRGDF